MRRSFPGPRRLVRAGCAIALALCCLPLLVASARAAPATYSGEANVASQSEGERNEALRTALAGIVMRLSGDSGALARSEVARAVAEAPRYVLQYQYRRDADAAGASRLVLVAEFDAVAVDRMLAALGLAGGGAAADGPPGTHRLWIAGLHSAVDYARALGYLGGHAYVREVRTLEARGDGVLVEVDSVSGLTRLLEAVAGEGTLAVNRASPPLEDIDATLALRP